MSSVEYAWRDPVTSAEVNRLHADAFDHDVYSDDEWPWADLLSRHSLGWCTARVDARLVGFLNVISDGFVHAWLQDVIVAASAQHQGIGTALVELAAGHAAAAGCEILHVDFAAEHADFYLGSCGFTPSAAGLRYLK